MLEVEKHSFLAQEKLKYKKVRKNDDIVFFSVAFTVKWFVFLYAEVYLFPFVPYFL